MVRAYTTCHPFLSKCWVCPAFAFALVIIQRARIFINIKVVLFCNILKQLYLRKYNLRTLFLPLCYSLPLKTNSNRVTVQMINNVTIQNNTFVGLPNGNRAVHASAQATNVTVVGNRPITPAPVPSNTRAFCNITSPEPCISALSGTGELVGACTGDHLHLYVSPKKISCLGGLLAKRFGV